MEVEEKNTPPSRPGDVQVDNDDRHDTIVAAAASTPSSSIVLKSLLKKPPSSPSNLVQQSSSRHKKTVSFNQTVIVFCEEIEGPSPSSDQYEPPIGYQDPSLDAFDPPKGYRDGKGKSESKKDTKAGRKNGIDILGEDSNLLSSGNILVDNESIIDAFNLDCDDISEEEFPINYLSTSNGFLCDDAVSDFDTNSESSISTERKALPALLESNTDSTHYSTEKAAPRKQVNDGYSERNHNSIPDAHNKSSDISRDDKQATIIPPSSSSSNSRSLPARMKVTQLDASLVKRHSTRPVESQDLNRTNEDRKKIESSSREESPSSRSPPSSTQKPLPQYPLIHHHFTDSSASSLKKEPLISSSSTMSSVARSDTSLLPPPQTKLPASSGQTYREDQRNTSQQDCHICRIIESNKIQSNPRPPVPKDQESNSNDRASNNTQPIVFNQSCVSCRDALVKQTITRPSNIEALQLDKSLTYQIVYVLDRNGNRMRALSLVKPQPVADGIPRERSQANYVGLVEPSKVPVTCAIPLSQANLQSAPNVVIPQYRLIRANNIQAQSLPTIGHQMNVRPQLTETAKRQPTIYYMRKPLDTKEMCQSPEFHAYGSRAFPDPHEVRRLDGLRAPIAQQSNLIKTTIPNAQNNLKHSTSQRKMENDLQDETDDPTFGFSKRPSVKVVATSSVTAPSQTQLVSRMYDHNFTKCSGNLIIQDSTQTLGRRPMHQTKMMKENLPSTNSLSNLNAILVGDPAIIPRSTSGPRANPITRGMNPSSITRWLASKLTNFPVPHPAKN